MVQNYLVLVSRLTSSKTSRAHYKTVSVLVLMCYVAADACTNHMFTQGLFSVVEMNASTIPEDIYYEMHLLAPETIRYRGYDCEEHKVETHDGYILTLYRVLPRARNGNESRAKPAVFLQHGLMDSAFTWVNNLPQQSLAFILADNGFDVWLGNSRGNRYSRQHRTLNPDTDYAFWDWDYDQLAAYDVPACVDYVTKFTGQEKISWVGHSQGCLIAFAGFINESVAQKIKTFVALAPAARVDHMASVLLLSAAPFATTVKSVLKMIGWKGEFMPNDNFYTWLGGTVCSNLPIICEEVIQILAGYDSPDMNATRLPVYFTHFPAGTSGRNIVHYAQAVEFKKFQHFDHGPLENFKRYKSLRPPEYELKNMKVPTAIFSGLEDKLADPEDVRWLASQVPNLIMHKEFEEYAHSDFLRGLSANELLYPTVLSLLR